MKNWHPNISITALATVFLTCSLAVNAFAEGVTDFSVEREFTGTVTPLTVNLLPYGYNDEYRGTIYYTLEVGTIFQGPTKDLQGNVIKQGDPLIKIYPQYREARVRKSEAALEEAKANLFLKQADYERYSKLQKSKSVSEQVYQQAVCDYATAKAALASAECDLALSKEMLGVCAYYAQFDGIVTNVLMAAGYCAGEPKVIEVTQLYPIGISIKMDRQLANQIFSTTPITVYPDPSISKDPIGIINGYNILTQNGVTFYSANMPLKANITEDGKTIPNVYKINNILPYEYDPSIRSININALKKDDKGYFLWKGVGQKNLQPGKGLSKVFPINKVYIVPDNLIEQISPSDRFVKLKDSGSFTCGDIVVSDPPEGAKDGDKVCFVQYRYILMPGDVVKVKIGPNQN